MPSITFKPRVKETSITTGTGNITLAGAVAGYQSFDDAFVVTDDYFYYCIEGVDGNGVPTGQWEEGIGHLSGSTTLVRDTLLSSSTGSAVSFSAGTKNVFCTVAAGLFGVQPQILSTTSIDFDAAANTLTNLYTVPSDRQAHITDILMSNLSGDNETCAFTIGWTSSFYNGVLSQTPFTDAPVSTGVLWRASSYDGTGGFMPLAAATEIGDAGDVLKLKLTSPRGSSLTGLIHVVGYLVDTSGNPMPGK